MDNVSVTAANATKRVPIAVELDLFDTIIGLMMLL